jgi:hypothetical protein
MSVVMPRAAGTPIHQHAADNLRFIRDTMARAGRFAAVPGWGGAAMGFTALVTAAFAGPPADGTRWLGWWLADAVIAILIGSVAMARKARRLDSTLTTGASLQFARVFLPVVSAGAILTAVFVANGLTPRLPGCWLVTYGAAVAAAGALAVGPVARIGFVILAIGVLAFASPAGWGNVYMALGFGVTQIVGGIAIGRAHHG